MSPDDAKSQSEAFLREHGVQINPTLPVIEPLDELSPQDAQAVATRAVILSYVIGLGYGQTGDEMKRPLGDFGLLDAASAEELRLLNAEAITEQDKINCTWLTECAQGLVYCIGRVSLDPFRQCDDDLASHFPASHSDPSDFISSATLRPFDDIYQQADLYYRLHWAVRQSQLSGEECTVKEGLIRERRKAIDWVIGVEADWDEIPMDT